MRDLARLCLCFFKAKWQLLGALGSSQHKGRWNLTPKALMKIMSFKQLLAQVEAMDSSFCSMIVGGSMVWKERVKYPSLCVQWFFS